MNTYPQWPNSQPNTKHFVPKSAQPSTDAGQTSAPSAKVTPITAKKRASKELESQYPADLYPW